MGEGDAEAAAATFARFVVEACLVAFAQFTGNIQAQAGAFVLRGVERLEDALQLVCRYAFAVVERLSVATFQRLLDGVMVISGLALLWAAAR